MALLNDINNQFVYDVGATIGDFIVQRWGRETVIALMRASGNLLQVVPFEIVAITDAEVRLLTEWAAAPAIGPAMKSGNPRWERGGEITRVDGIL